MAARVSTRVSPFIRRLAIVVAHSLQDTTGNPGDRGGFCGQCTVICTLFLTFLLFSMSQYDTLWVHVVGTELASGVTSRPAQRKVIW